MKRILTLIISMLVITVMFSMTCFASRATENNVISDDGSGEWIIVDNEDIYAVRFFSEDNPVAMPRYVSQVLNEGNRALNTSEYSYLCNKPNRNYFWGGDGLIELWNGGDEESNGAVTFKVGTTEVAVASNSGAQVQVKINNSIDIYAKANWYNANYFIRVIEWYHS